MVKRATFVCVLLAGLLWLGGCASIINGTTQKVGFSSMPSGASVSVNNRPIGTTPTFVELSRKDTHFVKVEMAGYESYEIALNRKASAWTIGNVVLGIIGLPIGVAVDALSGGLYKLEPADVVAQLTRQTSAEALPDTLYVFVVSKPERHWEKIEMSAGE